MTVIYLLLIYFLPTLIAWVRKHDKLEEIAKVNLYIGWMVYPWFAALYAAFDDKWLDD